MAQVFNRCLLGEIKNKTRVLVTNQLQFVNAADVVVFMSDGEVAEMGGYSELIAKNGSFAKMMAEAQVMEPPTWL